MRRNYPYPNCKETTRLLKKRVVKSSKHRGRAAIEAIRAKIDSRKP